MNFRIGIGYDAHRLVQKRKLIIAGVDIPYDKGLLGHSDADVLTHAIIDAILGAAGLGDIGRQFPTNDMSLNGISSFVLLDRVADMIKEANLCVVNIDSIIIAQKPRFAPYIDKMRDNLARRLNISYQAVNVKATTEEGMGYTGTGEGISAQAICMLKEI